jgi:hypothetical protein
MLRILLHIEVLTNHGKFHGHHTCCWGARLVLPWVHLLGPRIWGPKYTGYHYDLNTKFSYYEYLSTVVCTWYGRCQRKSSSN